MKMDHRLLEQLERDAARMGVRLRDGVVYRSGRGPGKKPPPRKSGHKGERIPIRVLSPQPSLTEPFPELSPEQALEIGKDFMRTTLWEMLADDIERCVPEVGPAELSHAHAIFNRIVDNAEVDMNPGAYYRAPTWVLYPHWYWVHAAGNIAYYCYGLGMSVFVDEEGDVVHWSYGFGYSKRPRGPKECHQDVDWAYHHICEEGRCIQCDENGNVFVNTEADCSSDDLCKEIYRARDLALGFRNDAESRGCFDEVEILDNLYKQLKGMEKEHGCI